MPPSTKAAPQAPPKNFISKVAKEDAAAIEDSSESGGEEQDERELPETQEPESEEEEKEQEEEEEEEELSDDAAAVPGKRRMKGQAAGDAPPKRMLKVRKADYDKMCLGEAAACAAKKDGK